MSRRLRPQDVIRSKASPEIQERGAGAILARKPAVHRQKTAPHSPKSSLGWR